MYLIGGGNRFVPPMCGGSSEKTSKSPDVPTLRWTSPSMDSVSAVICVTNPRVGNSGLSVIRSPGFVLCSKAFRGLVSKENLLEMDRRLDSAHHLEKEPYEILSSRASVMLPHMRSGVRGYPPTKPAA